jgi:AcrR family transcriptional regulator
VANPKLCSTTSVTGAIRPPQQRRSRASFDRVLEAGADLLREVGFDGFTLQELSRRASVSIGAIYARAPSKQALLLAIYDREMERIAQREQRVQTDSHRSGLRGRALVETLVRELAELILSERATLRVFMQRAASDEVILQRGAERSQALARVFAAALLEHRDELAHPDPEIAIDVAFRMVYCTLARRITHGDRFESDRELPDDRLVQELATAAADYLTGAPPRPR